MNVDSLKEKYLPVLKEHFLVIVLGFVGALFIGYGLIYFNVTKSDSRKITFETGGKESTFKAKTNQNEILVDVEGAVLKPGIHKLPSGSRVQDALVAAGGMSAQADRITVSKGINLAAKVIDGGKIYIPFEGESLETLSQNSSSIGRLGADTGLLNLNTADESDLDALSGVGPATAQKIISARPYASVDQLLTKKVVGKTVFEKIKDKVTAQ